jgi:bifunctional UDP-N-acetylglucosamine pyrophosphorylase/glucosamine-1-phosphate N-acetyltransferase
MSRLTAIILAAGKGTRMKSSRSKVLHEVCGRPMLSYVVDAARSAGAEDIVLVINPEMIAVKDLFQDTVQYVFQEQQLGTGHAVQMAEGLIGNQPGEVLVLCGDTPLLTGDLLTDMIGLHHQTQAAATVLTAKLDDPTGYGRIIRSATGSVERIVEERDATLAERAILEINTGSYCFDAPSLFAALAKIGCDNAQGEYYLTDVIPILQAAGQPVQAHLAPEPMLTQGINNRLQLVSAEAFLRTQIRERHMLAGVTILDPASTFIDSEVTIGCDTVIYPFTILEGKTSIGENCIIGPSAQIKDSIIQAEACVRHAVLSEAQVGPKADVGPFTHLRPGTVLAEESRAGTFVEIKKSYIGPDSKVPHLSYVGDAKLGHRVNIGAGTITCNYDGVKKHLTVIEDDVFIGSNTNLVAPLTIGHGAYTGAGSTISRDVPADALGLERAEQKNIEGWAERRRQKALLRKKEE